MKTVYAQGESVIKEWGLGQVKGGKHGDTVSTLTVTNKRLIYIENNKFGAKRKEEQLKCIRSVSGEVVHGKMRTWKVVISIILCVVVVGFFMLWKEYKRSKKGHYLIQIKTIQALGWDSYTLNFGRYAGEIAEKKGLFGRLKAKMEDENELEIEFDPKVINEVLETLGSIVMESQQ